MSLFYYFEVQLHDWGRPKNGPFLDQKWPSMADLSTFQSGPKGTKMVNFCSEAPRPNPALSFWGKKIQVVQVVNVVQVVRVAWVVRVVLVKVVNVYGLHGLNNPIIEKT